MSWSVVRRVAVRPSVRPCVNFFFKQLLLWNYLLDFDEILQKCSCHGPLQNFLKKFDSVKNFGCHGNKTEKKLKTSIYWYLHYDYVNSLFKFKVSDDETIWGDSD